MSSFSQITNAMTKEPWLFIAILLLVLAAVYFIGRAIRARKKKTTAPKASAQALPKESDARPFVQNELTKPPAEQLVSPLEVQAKIREPEIQKSATEQALPAPKPPVVAPLVKVEKKHDHEKIKKEDAAVPKSPVSEAPALKAPGKAPAKSEQSVAPLLHKEIVEEKSHPVLPEVVSVPHLDEAPKKALGTALRNTRGGFMAKLASLFSRGSTISDEDFEELEAILFTADIGAKTAQKLLDAVRARVKAAKLQDKSAIRQALKEEMRAVFDRAPSKEAFVPVAEPTVYMFVGVNGAGKTTSIGKLGAQMAASGKKVYFGAGDTFRAAAVMQLSIWGERSHIPVVTGKENADSAAVLFDAIAQAKAANADAIFCDTAGRLHTKVGLMDELKKVHRVLGKAQAGAPHEVFLVIDATMGQNAIAQAREFAEATPLTGVVLSKLDGTAKGGVALGIVDELGVPIRFVGVGEGRDDLRPFDADEFVEALFSENER